MSKQSEIIKEFIEANKKFSYIKKLPLSERTTYMNLFAGILEMIIDLLPEEWALLHIKLNEKTIEELKKNNS